MTSQKCESTDVAFVYGKSVSGGDFTHPVHRMWAASIGADAVPIYLPTLPGRLQSSFLRDVMAGKQTALPTDYDIYLFDGSTTLFALPELHSRNRSATMIYLEATWSREISARDLTGDSFPITIMKNMDKRFQITLLNQILDKYIDGFITVSELYRGRLMQEFDRPVRVAIPYIQESHLPDLNSVYPSYESNRAIVICDNRYHKGVDRLVDQWAYVRNSVPDAELLIVGKRHPEKYEEIPGVEVLGFVDQLSTPLSRCSLYVHPARLDACPVSVAEAMYAGLPAIVTETTGRKELVEKLDKSLVCANDQDAIADAVISYFNTSPERRRHLGDRARKVAESVREKNRRNEFKYQFRSLMNEITR